MSDRPTIPKSVRFEVFKRDKFTCQYCGKKAPDVVLVIDHINPVSKGGVSDIINLITSCEGCNSGKSDRPLSDGAALEKARAQLEALEERRQQLAMMVEWRESLTKSGEILVDSVVRLFESAYNRQFPVNDEGRKSIRTLIKKFGYDDVCDAVDLACERYLQWNGAEVVRESVEDAFRKIGGICHRKNIERTDPQQAEMWFAFNIWRKVSGYVSGSASRRAIDLLTDALAGGMEPNELRRICANSPGISRLTSALTQGGDDA